MIMNACLVHKTLWRKRGGRIVDSTHLLISEHCYMLKIQRRRKVSGALQKLPV